MSAEELVAQLKELTVKRPYELKGTTKDLFETIMSVIDERDTLKEKIKDFDILEANSLLAYKKGWQELKLYLNLKKMTTTDVYTKMLEIENKIDNEVFGKNGK